ncbi:MAG: Usg family protein [Rhodospirillales bacterium]|nr:Usg family protein [Rhodospirillales bacterium]
MSDLARQLADYRLTTAEIIYCLPDHPTLLQSYIWQELDLAPEFPVLKKFLAFWERHIEGRLHTVRVASCQIIKPAAFRANAHLLTLH